MTGTRALIALGIVASGLLLWAGAVRLRAMLMRRAAKALVEQLVHIVERYAHHNPKG